MRRELWVELGPRRYPIYIGRGLLDGLARHLDFSPASSALLAVSNPTVKALCGSRLEAGLAAGGRRFGWALVPDSEEAKSLSVLADLYQQALALELDRRSAVLALGGGVVGDVAGFLAATYLRGIAYVQIPTTLLAQVDSSVGGKVAVNLPQGKNLVGAFYQPRLVLADLDSLATLPAREWRCGLAEVVKYGVIGDPELFALLEEKVALLAPYTGATGEARPTGEGRGRGGDHARKTLAAEDPASVSGRLSEEVAGLLEEIVWRCCRLKAEVVARDEREEEGHRMILNFGHTVGHALEALTGYRDWRHGEAVAVGMVAAGRLAVRLGLWTAAEAERLEALLRAFGLPVRLPPGPEPETIVAAMYRDKKVVGGSLTLVLPRRLGEVEVVRGVPEEQVLAALRETGY
ncbi:MAG: 3-dehydroquinate synthase [Moorellales bacterium]